MKYFTAVASCLFVLLYRSNSEELKNQSYYWRYISLNGSSPLLFQNIQISVENTGGKNEILKQDSSSAQSQSDLISFRLQTLLPPFAITHKNLKNAKCKKDSDIFLKALNKMDLWALKMYDASAKFPSGLLSGNINQFGDFDECLSIDEPDFEVKGKYCLAFFQIGPSKKKFESENIFRIFNMIQSHFLFRSKLTDPGHRIPKFSTVNWGLCIPQSCSSEDVELQLKDIIDKQTNGTGFEIEIRVEDEMCQEKKSFKVSTSFLIVSFFFSSVLLLAIVATIRDQFFKVSQTGNFWPVLHCFSLKRNGKALLNTSQSSDDIKSVHGVRMINAIMLIICHKSMALFFTPYSNRAHIAEKTAQSWITIVRMASLYTDSFIMISGLLSSYSLTKDLKEKGKINLKDLYFKRLIRVIPPLAAIIVFCTYILPEMGSGPQWNLAVGHHAEKCKKTWWRNFLFIHNYFGFENMCLTHTHHIGIDTQLFFISPILVYILFYWPYYGFTCLIGLATLSTLTTYQTTLEKNLSYFIYPGASVAQLFDTANHSYIIPFHRLTVYIIGIFLGFALRFYEKGYKIKPYNTRIAWTIAFSFLSYIFSKANDMNHLNYVYNNKEAATYAALAPIAWCLFLGWFIFVSQLNCEGAISKILSSKYFVIWTRLSYSVYLTQFPIFFFNIGLQRYSGQFSFLLLANFFEYFAILLASTLLTLLFDMPFANLKKLISRG